MLLWIIALFALAVAFGIWRRFGPIQWIWLLFGSAITLIVLWVILLTFFIGPEMVRTGVPGGMRR